MNESVPKLEASLKEHFAPTLRSQGFTGSGRTYRRIVGDFLQVVNVQGSRHSGQFAINLGLQPLAIPDVRGDVPDVKKITQELCEFHRRLSESGVDQWWQHENTQASMDAAVKSAIHVFLSVGCSLFAQVSNDASPFLTIRAEQYRNGQFNFSGFGSTNVRTILALARLRFATAQFDEACAFARMGLEDVGNIAWLRRELRSLVFLSEKSLPMPARSPTQKLGLIIDAEPA